MLTLAYIICKHGGLVAQWVDRRLKDQIPPHQAGPPWFWSWARVKNNRRFIRKCTWCKHMFCCGHYLKRQAVDLSSESLFGYSVGASRWQMIILLPHTVEQTSKFFVNDEILHIFIFNSSSFTSCCLSGPDTAETWSLSVGSSSCRYQSSPTLEILQAKLFFFFLDVHVVGIYHAAAHLALFTACWDTFVS